MKMPLRIASDIFVVMQYNQSAKIHQKSINRNNYRLYSYEDLIVSPDEVIKGLCEYADFSYTEDMLYPRAGQPSSLTGERRGGIDGATASRWKDVLYPLEAKLITSLTSGSCDRLGFDPVTHPVYKVKS